MTDLDQRGSTHRPADGQQESNMPAAVTLGTEFYPKEATREKLRGDRKLTSPADLPISKQHELIEAAQYIAAEGLVDAFNVSLVLGQPLLLTGEPGTGKTQFAYSAVYWLGFKQLIRFNVKSTTQARDFFYHIDEIRRFRDAQLLTLKGRKKTANPKDIKDKNRSEKLSGDPLDT